MKAVRFAGNGAVEVIEKAIPEIREDEILVKVAYCGLCGSERGAVRNGIGVVPGHESSGTVEKCGSRVKPFPRGCPVLIYLSDYCGECEACLEGETNRCVHRRGLIGWHFDGGYEEYVAVPGRMVFPIDGFPLDLGVLALDTIGTAFHGLRQAEPICRDGALVIGCGPIGLGCVSILKNHYGVGEIFAADISQEHRQMAEMLGATAIAVDPADTAGSIERVLQGRRIGLVMEVCGSEATTAAAVKFVRAGGKVLYIGEPVSALHIRRESEWILKDFSFMNSWYFPTKEIPDNLRFILENEKEVRRIITDVVSMEEMAEAYARFFSGKTGKVLVRIGDAAAE